MKKILAFVLTTIIVTSIFTGCMEAPAGVYDENNDITVRIEFADLAKVPDYKDVYYSVNTLTVYYVYKKPDVKFSYMAPYISNGHTCEYINGEIVEVIPTVRIEDIATE